MRRCSVMDTEHTPPFVSMHRGVLKILGGTENNLYDARFDNYEGDHKRFAATVCRKDFRANSRRDYRPWQRIQYAQ